MSESYIRGTCQHCGRLTYFEDGFCMLCGAARYSLKVSEYENKEGVKNGKKAGNFFRAGQKSHRNP